VLQVIERRTSAAGEAVARAVAHRNGRATAARLLHVLVLWRCPDSKIHLAVRLSSMLIPTSTEMSISTETVRISLIPRHFNTVAERAYWYTTVDAFLKLLPKIEASCIHSEVYH
jgi:hypothetical protein